MTTYKALFLIKAFRAYGINPEVVIQFINDNLKKSRKKPKLKTFEQKVAYNEQQIRNFQVERLKILLEMR